MAVKLKVQTDNYKLKAVGSDGAKFKASVGIPIYPDPYTGEYEVTPTEEEQTLSANGLMMTDDVTVHAVSSTYVGSDIPQRTSDDVTVSADTVTVPNGYYEEGATKTVQSGSATTPTGGITANPTISVSSSGLITASVTKSESITPIVNEGYVTTGQAGTVTFSGSATSQLSTQGSSTISPTESEQTAVTSGKYTTGDIKVGAISSSYVGSGITRRDGDDLSASGAIVSVPSGYYAENASKSVATGNISTPYITKGTVTNNSMKLTPYYTRTAGYIAESGTYSGTQATVTASELVSGTKSITENATGIDVTNYASVNVAVPSDEPNLQTKTNIDPTTSSQTITADTGYDGLDSVQINAMPAMTLPSLPHPTTPSGTKKATINYQVTADRYLNIPTGYNGTAQYYEIKGVPNGTVTAPSTITATGATSSVSIANQTITLTKAVSVTPSVTTVGYISSGTAGNASVSLTASDITFRESDSLIVNGKEVTAPVGYYPAHAYASVADGTAGTPVATKGSVSNHTISVTPSVTNTTGYITGSTKTGTAVTVSASELVSGSETKTENGTYDVTNLASLVVNVSGGTSKNTQVVQGTTRTTSSTLTAIGAELTVSKTGTYDIYWSAFRSSTSSSYTYATQLYIDGTAHGSENSTWSNHCQNNHLTNVSLTINQKLRVRGRESRGSTYYIYAPTLVIVEK